MISNNLSESSINYFQRRIIKAGIELYTPYAWRSTKNKFHALTAEILLQRTNADQVLPVYLYFTSKYKCPEDFINSPENLFVSLGLIWRYEVYLKLCSKLSIMNEIPDIREELIKLPGVGEYVSSALRSLHLKKRDYIIDSNIVKLYGRFFGFNTNGETRRKRWFIELADSFTPKIKFKDYNYGLIDLTRQICKKNPDCSNCILKKKCNFYKNSL